MSSDEPEVFLVQKGALFFDLELGAGRRQILLLLLPGDAYDSRVVPRCSPCRLMAAGPTEIIRLQQGGLAAIEASEPLAAAAITARCIEQLARALVHHGSIGRLSGEERVASYLIEIGARSDALGAHAATIEMPLARADIADYLALNADTLSRIMSRLRAKGAIGRSTRGTLMIKSWPTLRAMSPLSESIWHGG